MNGIKHELVGSTSAAAAAASYPNALLYGPTPSWMGSDTFSGKKTKKKKTQKINWIVWSTIRNIFLRFIKIFFVFRRILLDLTGGCQSFKIEKTLKIK